MGVIDDIYLGLWCAGALISASIESAVYKVKNFFGGYKYNESVESTINVESELAKFRDSIQPDVESTEEECMNKIASLYDKLYSLVEDEFPDMSDMIETEKENVRSKLSGMIMQYVKEHLSENDDKLLEVLKMSPGPEKASEMEKQTKRVLRNAEKHFNKYLKKNVLYISNEVNKRLSMRLSDQEKYMEMKICGLEQLEKELKSGSVNVELIVNEISPQLEAAQCTIGILQSDY